MRANDPALTPTTIAINSRRGNEKVHNHRAYSRLVCVFVFLWMQDAAKKREDDSERRFLYLL